MTIILMSRNKKMGHLNAFWLKNRYEKPKLFLKNRKTDIVS